MAEGEDNTNTNTGERELENNNLNTNTSATTTQEEREELLTIHLKMIQRETMTIHVQENIQIAELRQTIAQAADIAEEEQPRLRLIYKGKVLKNELYLVQDYHFQNDDTIHVIRGRAGISPGPGASGTGEATSANSTANTDSGNMNTMGRTGRTGQERNVMQFNVTSQGERTVNPARVGGLVQNIMSALGGFIQPPVAQQNVNIARNENETITNNSTRSRSRTERRGINSNNGTRDRSSDNGSTSERHEPNHPRGRNPNMDASTSTSTNNSSNTNETNMSGLEQLENDIRDLSNNVSSMYYPNNDEASRSERDREILRFANMLNHYGYVLYTLQISTQRAAHYLSLENSLRGEERHTARNYFNNLRRMLQRTAASMNRLYDELDFVCRRLNVDLPGAAEYIGFGLSQNGDTEVQLHVIDAGRRFFNQSNNDNNSISSNPYEALAQTAMQGLVNNFNIPPMNNNNNDGIRVQGSSEQYENTAQDSEGAVESSPSTVPIFHKILAIIFDLLASDNIRENILFAYGRVRNLILDDVHVEHPSISNACDLTHRLNQWSHTTAENLQEFISERNLSLTTTETQKKSIRMQVFELVLYHFAKNTVSGDALTDIEAVIQIWKKSMNYFLSLATAFLYYEDSLASNDIKCEVKSILSDVLIRCKREELIHQATENKVLIQIDGLVSHLPETKTAL